MFRPCAVVLALALFPPALAARQTADYDEALYDSLEYRCIGPFRGGRSAAVTGVPDDPMTYWFGSCGGGVWRTEDAGQTWANVSDGFFGGSIGAVAVSEADPNVVYVGGGEVTVRGNVSHGPGMWKSTDRGKTWTAIGLADSRHIPRIRIHPRDPNLVYAAVLGHLFGPNEVRGLYRSKDGGATWERVLFANDSAGAVDVVLDPYNPRVVFASTWRVRRTPYSLESGGDGSRLWKSTDGGDTWTDVTHATGMPTGTVGIIGVAVSPAVRGRVFAIVEAENGGVFRSDDGGETWARVNDERKLRQRAWYYSRIYADPGNADTVYVVNVALWRSKDGGKSFESIRTPHGDHHDLWISPADPRRMIVGDDGGAQITFNGGTGWSTYENQPTAQFYRVTTDDHFPYRIYGAQQDNSTVRILHRTDGRGISRRDWEPTAGGESGWIAPDPVDPDVVYGGSYGGYLERLDHRTGQSRMVDVWPRDPMGHGAEDMNPRFQWSFPLFFSLHDPHALYAAGNMLFRTTNEGQSWQAVSPDLTRHDPSTLGSSGGPITKDNTGVEYYATIFAVAESPREVGVVWCGSDDGLVHVTRNGGADWTNVTPPREMMPEWIQINCLEVDPFRPGGVYVAATMYKSDDFAPYVFRTSDYGRTWTKITDGIAPDHFTRVVRADPARQGLLYAGTECGMYVSFDDGAHWKPFQLNLPVVPVTDLAVKEGELVVATQGRSFWVLDDLSPLHQLTAEVAASRTWLFTPRPTYRLRGGGGEKSRTEGRNAADGVVFHYHLAADPGADEVHLEILEEDGTLIRAFRAEATEKAEGDSKGEAEQDEAEDEAKDASPPLPAKQGMNRFVWDLRHPPAKKFPGLILWGGSLRGPRVMPGTYRARLTVGEDVRTVAFEVRPDPRSRTSPADLQAQLEFLLTARDGLTRAHEALVRIRDVRGQIEALTVRLAGDEEHVTVVDAGAALAAKLTAVEETLYQTKNRSDQDPLNFPIRLNNELSALASSVARGDFAPTEQARSLLDRLTIELDAALATLSATLREDLPAFNHLVLEHGIPRILDDGASAAEK